MCVHTYVLLCTLSHGNCKRISSDCEVMCQLCKTLVLMMVINLTNWADGNCLHMLLLTVLSMWWGRCVCSEVWCGTLHLWAGLDWYRFVTRPDLVPTSPPYRLSLPRHSGLYRITTLILGCVCWAPWTCHLPRYQLVHVRPSVRPCVCVCVCVCVWGRWCNEVEVCVHACSLSNFMLHVQFQMKFMY